MIFYHSPEQEAAAEASKEALAKSGASRRPIVTEIVPAREFWRAEEYHQQYLEKRGLAQCRLREPRTPRKPATSRRLRAGSVIALGGGSYCNGIVAFFVLSCNTANPLSSCSVA